MTVGCAHCGASRRSILRGLAGAVVAGASISAATSARSAGSALPVVDFHAHVVEPSLIPNAKGRYFEIFEEARRRPGWVGKLSEPRHQLADMDLHGVDCHVVGQSNAIQGISWGDAAHDLEIHRRINDGIAERWVAAHPGRFIGAFGLPTQDLKLAIPELERAVTKLGHKVLQVSSHTPDGIYYGDPRLHPLWEAIAHFDVTVFIHPHGQLDAPPLDRFGLNNSVGQPIEEAKVMSSIIYEGVFDRFPDVKIVVAHGGGFLPHYHGRMDRNVTNVPGSAEKISRLPSAYLRQFYYDSCVYSPDIMAALIKAVGTERIVLGGDYPVGAHDPVAALRKTPAIDDVAVDMILRRTSSRLLGLAA